jgi:hypothetical protein
VISTKSKIVKGRKADSGIKKEIKEKNLNPLAFLLMVLDFRASFH